ncbi:hypothetical protein F8M41_014404 [Gigaspora margarita]|uniref:Uncharacterized protein n=1 Tax=Gigaspora margarita TaxID=4874 RepID=A0A8H3WYM6_GIGMA|nr:hypothetical protein F8M41_014404 [Gigaspora margarita]
MIYASSSNNDTIINYENNYNDNSNINDDSPEVIIISDDDVNDNNIVDDNDKIVIYPFSLSIASFIKKERYENKYACLNRLMWKLDTKIEKAIKKEKKEEATLFLKERGKLAFELYYLREHAEQ